MAAPDPPPPDPDDAVGRAVSADGEAALDEALEESFPASDPIALSPAGPALGALACSPPPAL